MTDPTMNRDFIVIKEMLESGETLTELQINKSIDVLYRIMSSSNENVILKVICLLENLRRDFYGY